GGQGELLEVVAALAAARRFARRLNRWQEQRHENADDSNHHQQLDQRKAGRSNTPDRAAEHGASPQARPRMVAERGKYQSKTGPLLGKISRIHERSGGFGETTQTPRRS